MLPYMASHGWQRESPVRGAGYEPTIVPPIVEPSILNDPRKRVRDSYVRDRRWRRLNAVAKSVFTTTSYAHSKRNRLARSRIYKQIRNFSKRRYIRHALSIDTTHSRIALELRSRYYVKITSFTLYESTSNLARECFETTSYQRASLCA